MIKTAGLCKSFDEIEAIKELTLEIRDSQVFGLVGTNGAGKSTFLRMVAGVYKADAGELTVDGCPVFDDPETKEDIFFVADEPYFFPNANATDMKKYYASIYPKFDEARFDKLLADFGLDPRRSIAKYSKGMKKQLAIILGICAGTKYLLCDETFDGLDPVMRQAVKSLFANDMVERGMTPVIASHNLRELEDICEHVGLLHRGGLLLSEDLSSMKLGLQKLQVAFDNEDTAAQALSQLRVVEDVRRGSIHTLVVRGEQEEILNYFRGVPTVFFEMLPLSLEEIFISETEVAGYDVKKLLLG